MSKDVISDEELEIAFLGTNFGPVDHRKLLEASVLKKAAGYYCGHTITQIMQRMKLIGANDTVLVRGRKVLQGAYAHLMRDGG